MEEKDLIEKYKKYIPGISVLFPDENWTRLITKEGLELHTYRFPAQSPKCVLLSLHGLNSYSQPTGFIAKELAGTGCEVLAYDFRGHGKSQGIRGYIHSIDDLIDDTLEYISLIQQLYPGLPLFLMGGSLGAAVVTQVSIRIPEKISGVILINPALGINSRFESVVRSLSNCLAFCCPTYPVYKSDPFRTSRNEHLHEYILENPFYYNGRIRIGTSAATLNAMKEIRKSIKFVTSRLLLIQGSDDKVTSIDKVMKFMKKVQVEDKTLLMYPGRPHSIVFEDAVFEISAKISDWVQRRTGKNEGIR
jgi:acylglycerol lipase